MKPNPDPVEQRKQLLRLLQIVKEYDPIFTPEFQKRLNDLRKDQMKRNPGIFDTTFDFLSVLFLAGMCSAIIWFLAEILL